ncbi:MAG: glycerophosphodiester phosphodiesterase, partial [Kaistella sp.]
MLKINYLHDGSHAELDSASHETLNQVHGDKLIVFFRRSLRKNLAHSAVKFLCLFFSFSFSFSCFSQNPIIIAHRGASAYAPENTLAAFEKAIEMGATVIETDVHQTKDCVVVVMHDLSLDRTTDGKGLIKDLMSFDFEKLIIDSHPKLVSSSGVENLSNVEKHNDIIHSPTLEQTIQLINGRCQLLIEIKKGDDYYPGIEKN